MEALISVIVPIYNVAPYLRRCLDSLLHQTMKQIEIICVDDGSTDDSGRIADEYENKWGDWPRFRVIHTENRGLSAARNRGIDEAKSDWIMFVDSDDWVDERFCEIPYDAALEHGADLVIFGRIVEKNSKKRQENQVSTPTGIVKEFVAHEFGRVEVWNKLYKCKIFDGIRFPEGRVFEDIATTHKIIHVAKQIVFLRDELYHYVYRNGGISHTHTLMIRRDRFISTMERYDDLSSWQFPKEKIQFLLEQSAMGFLSVAPPCNDEVYLKAERVVGSIKGMPKTLPLKQRVALIAWRIDKRLFYMICRVMGKQKSKSISY